MKQTEGYGSTVRMGEIWPLPSLYGGSGMVSGCEACHGGNKHMCRFKTPAVI